MVTSSSVGYGDNHLGAYDDLSSIERLSNEVLGKIIEQLPNAVGSEGVLNEADIPVIMRYMQNLACTSSRMNALVHDPYITKLFLCTLAKKYKNEPSHYAAELNTEAARKYLWDYIKENKFDEAYSVIQNIYALAASVLQEAKEEGLNFDYLEGRKGWPSPNPYYYQTQSGFFLYCDWAPNHIATPFGEITIYGGGSSSGNSPLSVSEVFIKRMNATFECVTRGLSGRREGKFYEITQSSMDSDKIRKIDEDELKQINEQDLEGKKGSQSLIVNSYCGNTSVYKIRQIGEKILDDPKYYDSESSKRSYKLIHIIWEMLERNRLGKDPVSKDLKPLKKDRNIAKEKFLLFKNVSEVAHWGIDLIKNLSEQSIFQGKTLFDIPQKVLVLKSYGEARLLELLNNAAGCFLKKNTQWSVSTFGCGNNRLTLNGRDLGEGVILHLFESNDKPCDLVEIARAYKNAVKRLGENWELTTLRKYPDIFSTESEEDYALFIKRGKSLPAEDTLIRFLADKLGISKFISCQSSWKGQTFRDAPKPIYLWVRKDKLKEVQQALQLHPSDF